MIDSSEYARVLDERNASGAEAHRLRNAMKKAIESLTYDDDEGVAARSILGAALVAEDEHAARATAPRTPPTVAAELGALHSLRTAVRNAQARVQVVKTSHVEIERAAWFGLVRALEKTNGADT